MAGLPTYETYPLMDHDRCVGPTNPWRVVIGSGRYRSGKLPVLQNGVDDPYSLASSAVRILSRSVSCGMVSGVAGVTGEGRLHQSAHPLDLRGLDLQVGELPWITPVSDG